MCKRNLLSDGAIFKNTARSFLHVSNQRKRERGVPPAIGLVEARAEGERLRQRGKRRRRPSLSLVLSFPFWSLFRLARRAAPSSSCSLFLVSKRGERETQRALRRTLQMNDTAVWPFSRSLSPSLSPSLPLSPFLPLSPSPSLSLSLARNRVRRGIAAAAAAKARRGLGRREGGRSRERDRHERDKKRKNDVLKKRLVCLLFFSLSLSLFFQIG